MLESKRLRKIVNLCVYLCVDALLSKTEEYTIG